MTSYGTRRRRVDPFTLFTAGGSLVILVLFAALFYASYLFSTTTVETLYGVKVVRDGERVCETTGEGSVCQYLEFTDGEVFKNVDSIWHAKWNSSDVHAKMREGMVCDLQVNGWRIPLFSSYRNVLWAQCAFPRN